MKKQLINEAKRLQELAGIKEIKINDPSTPKTYEQFIEDFVRNKKISTITIGDENWNKLVNGLQTNFSSDLGDTSEFFGGELLDMLYDMGIDVNQDIDEIKINDPTMHDKWNESISQLLDFYNDGNDNQYNPGYKHEFQQNVELDTDDDLISFYNFLKTQSNKTYIGYHNNIPVSVTADTRFEDEDLGNLIVKFTEPDSWDF